MNKANLLVPEINFVLNTIQTRKQHLIGPIQIYSTDIVTKITSLLKHILNMKHGVYYKFYIVEGVSNLMAMVGYI